MVTLNNNNNSIYLNTIKNSAKADVVVNVAQCVSDPFDLM